MPTGYTTQPYGLSGWVVCPGGGEAFYSTLAWEQELLIASRRSADYIFAFLLSSMRFIYDLEVELNTKALDFHTEPIT